MKYTRKAICFALVILIGLGACRCMNHNEYSGKILEALSNKYNKNFEITKLSYEVDGENGSFYRAVCKEEGSKNTFVAYYYLKGSDYLLAEEMGKDLPASKNEPLLVDTYPNLLLNAKVAEELTDHRDVLFAVADVGTFGYMLSVEDVEKGIEHCLSNEQFDVQAKVFLFVSNSIEDKDQFEKEITQTILAMNAYNQSIDIAYIDDKDADDIKHAYADDIYMIEARLKKDEKVVRYNWYFAERGKGITEKKRVKGA